MLDLALSPLSDPHLSPGLQYAPWCDQLHEFLTFLVHLAFARDGTTDVAALDTLLTGLSRSKRVDALKPLRFDAMSEGSEALTALAASDAAVAAVFAELGSAPVPERAWLQYLEGKKQIRSVIVTLPGGAGTSSADLTWQDASAAFLICAGAGAAGKPSSLGDKGAVAEALAVCALVKYERIAGLSTTQKIQGFLANLGGTKDEQAVVG